MSIITEANLAYQADVIIDHAHSKTSRKTISREDIGVTTDINMEEQTDALIAHVYDIINGKTDEPIVFWFDLFCGAGGTSTGIHLAERGRAFVVACVNHDLNAIYSHKENHSHALHFVEDIRDENVVIKLAKLAVTLRERFPNCIINIWASLECTNFSKAKGGLPRDADSRTLADHMPLYLRLISPDYFWVENVREFMSWGPLDEKGKPVSKTEGRDYIRWVEGIKRLGFRFDYKILNAANFGAYQSRERYFAQFAWDNLPICWPEQTHTKDKRANSLFPMKRWRAVKEILDLHDEGTSIFARKKPLSENTLNRIYAGLQKFVAKGEDTFIKKYYSGRPEGKVISIDGPAGTVKTADGQAVIKAAFIAQRNTGVPSSKVVDINGPARSLTATGGNQDVVSMEFLNTYYGNPGGSHSIETAAPTVPTKDRITKMLVQFLSNQYSNGGDYTDIDNPAGSVLNVPKQNLVTATPWIMDTNFGNVGRNIDEPASTLMACRKYPYLINANSSTAPAADTANPAPAITQRTHFLVNPGWGGHVSSANDPSGTVVASQHKAPLSVCNTTETDFEFIVFVYESDTPAMIKIKEFMCAYGITDIKMRMLNVTELKQIQGFPKDYILRGTQTEQKKYIGNAVEVTIAKALISANVDGIYDYYQKSA